MDRPASEPWGYLVTFTCYGVRLHGDARGSVDREHNGYGGRYAPEDHGRVDVARRLMSDDVVSLDEEERRVVLDAIVGSCRRQRWALHVAHVRSTHVHLVVSADVAPEVVMGKLKAFASRALNERFGRREKRWARHGSTRWLFDPRGVQGAVDYVVRGQGKPMSLWVNPNGWEEYWEGGAP